MSNHVGLPIAGYRPQSDSKVKMVNAHKADEERLLRHLDALQMAAKSGEELRWLSIAKTHFEQGYMALNRAVFLPERIKLPEDIES